MLNTRQIILWISLLVIMSLILILAWDSITPGNLILPAGFLKLLSDAEKMKEFIQRYKVFSPLVFFVIQTVQVIISPIPGNITTIIGGSLFGILWGSLLNISSIFLGSIIAFLLARKYGKPLVIRAVGKSVYDKYESIFERKYVVSLFLIFLFPFFPDDALCLLSGISSIPTGLFIFLLLTGRLPGILVGTLIGSGILELTIRGWIIISILLLSVLILTLIYGKKIQRWLYSKVIKWGQKA